jgi:hypothetical protein
MGGSDYKNGLCDLILSREHQPALLCHLVNHSVQECQSLTISTIHFVVCMSQALGRVSRWGEVELNRLLKQDEMILQGGSLCCRSALHSTGMAGIELAAVLGDSKASIDDMPLRRQLERVGHRVLCRTHWCRNRYADSEARIWPRNTAEEFVMKGASQGRARRGGGC